MLNNNFLDVISPFVASTSVAHWCAKLHDRYPFNFQLTKSRSSKLGDYRYQRIGFKKIHQITINSDLNKHQFLITSLIRVEVLNLEIE